MTVKSLLGQQMFAAFMLFLVLGALSMIWPAIIAVFLSVILLLQSFTAEPEVVMLSWAEADNLSVVIASLRRPGLPSIVS